MSDVLEEQEPQPPRGHVRVVYLGPVAPHWDVQSDYGDETVIDQFRDRTLARLDSATSARPPVQAKS